MCTSGEGPNAADQAENKDWRIRKRRSLPKKQNKNFALLKSIVNHSATIRPKRRSRVLEMARRIHLSRWKAKTLFRAKNKSFLDPMEKACTVGYNYYYCGRRDFTRNYWMKCLWRAAINNVFGNLKNFITDLMIWKFLDLWRVLCERYDCFWMT